MDFSRFRFHRKRTASTTSSFRFRFHIPGSNHLQILLTIPLSSVFRPNERLPSLNFRKARQDGFAFDLDYHCSSAEEYSSLFLYFAAVLFTSLTLNALLTMWCSGQTALFLSLLAKTGVV